MTSRLRSVDVFTLPILLVFLLMPGPLAAQQPEIATTVAFTEGPTVDRDGNVYFTDVINQRIMKLGADGHLFLRAHNECANVAQDPI